MKAQTIYDCFKHYTRKEVLDEKNKWKCDKCKLEVCSHKNTFI